MPRLAKTTLRCERSGLSSGQLGAVGSPPRRSHRLGTLLTVLKAVARWLDESGVPFAVIGGIAASLHGKPRVTKDVDVVAQSEEDSWPRLLAAARKQGLFPRIADALDFAKVTRVLLLTHRATAIDVDVSFGMLPFELQLISRARRRVIHGVSFPLASPEDIVVMKGMALRPRDVADIEGIVESQSSLDLKRVRSHLAQLSALLEGDDHVARLEEILRRVAS